MNRFSNSFLLLPVLAGLIFCGCAGGSGKLTERDWLTPDEEKKLTEQVRTLLLRSKRFNLDAVDREHIRATPPELHVRYTGHKSGQITVRWTLPRYRVLLLQHSGYLIPSRSSDWLVRIISDKATGSLPRPPDEGNGRDIPPRPGPVSIPAR